MKRVALMVLCLCLLLCGCGGTSKEQTQDNIMTISFEFGDRTGPYIGEIDKDGLPHGYGIFSSEKADGTSWTYTGEWDHGHWNGQGQTIWASGQSYSGLYTKDEITGLGVYTTPEGAKIMGSFVNSVPTGYCSVHLTGDYEGYIFWGYYENGNATGTVYRPDGKTAPATHIDGEINFDKFGFSNTLTETAPNEPTEATEATVTEPTEETVTEPTQATEEEEPQFTYTLNTSTRKFHKPNCSSAKKTKESNKRSFTGTRDEVISMGYKSCAVCNP